MQQAFRITFQRRDDDFEVRSIRRVAMRVPPGAPLEGEPRAGVFVELRGKGGKPLYRRLLGGEPGWTEAPTGDPDRPFERVVSPKGQLLHALVPAVPGARTVVITDTHSGPDQKPSDPREILMADLSDPDEQPRDAEQSAPGSNPRKEQD